MTVDVKIGTVSKWRENQSEKSFFSFTFFIAKCTYEQEIVKCWQRLGSVTWQLDDDHQFSHEFEPMYNDAVMPNCPPSPHLSIDYFFVIPVN